MSDNLCPSPGTVGTPVRSCCLQPLLQPGELGLHRGSPSEAGTLLEYYWTNLAQYGVVPRDRQNRFVVDVVPAGPGFPFGRAWGLALLRG